ncbi:MAG TPA: hypothetical protein VGO60_03835 [Iamia sp.]|nr:hypothetical protein [Iamia sp.]
MRGALAALVGWAAVAGIGKAIGGDAGSSRAEVPEGPLTHEQYVVHADRACLRETLDHMSGGGLGAVLSGDGERMAEDMATKVHATVVAQVGALRDLPVPAGEEATVTAMLASFDRYATSVEELLAVGSMGEEADAAATRMSTRMQERQDLLHTYGITGCG